MSRGVRRCAAAYSSAKRWQSAINATRLVMGQQGRNGLGTSHGCGCLESTLRARENMRYWCNKRGAKHAFARTRQTATFGMRSEIPSFP